MTMSFVIVRQDPPNRRGADDHPVGMRFHDLPWLKNQNFGGICYSTVVASMSQEGD